MSGDAAAHTTRDHLGVPIAAGQNVGKGCSLTRAPRLGLAAARRRPPARSWGSGQWRRRPFASHQADRRGMAKPPSARISDRAIGCRYATIASTSNAARDSGAVRSLPRCRSIVFATSGAVTSMSSSPRRCTASPNGGFWPASTRTHPRAFPWRGRSPHATLSASPPDAQSTPTRCAAAARVSVCGSPAITAGAVSISVSGTPRPMRPLSSNGTETHAKDYGQYEWWRRESIGGAV
jgi:hypothetical protein